MVVEEQGEHCAGLYAKARTANLQPGEYDDVTCGCSTNLKGKLIVTGSRHQRRGESRCGC